jgi:hypothetical protein
MPVTDDPRALLVQLVVRLRAAAEAERVAVVEQLLPLLNEKRVPLAVRMAAAARAVESLPDTPAAIRGVVAALTAGLSPSQALHRLRHLQHLTEKSDALDAAVEAREQKVKLDCPRCGVKLPRAEMAKHLWHDHGGLTLVQGKTRSRAGAVQALRREYAALGDPALFDRAAEVGGEPAARGWAAETASPEEALPLCAAACERGVSLCPACFADVPPAVPGLPPPLALAHGRIGGEGHSAAAQGAFPPRVSAALAAGVVLLAFALVAPFVRGSFLLWMSCFLSLAGFAYLVTLLVLWPRRSPDDAAIDAAWRKLAPRLADRGSAARFLTRLCLTSLGRGDPMERAQTLNRVIARARDDPDERALLAAALVLQVDDGARYGRDRAEGIAELAGRAFRDREADFAALVLAAYLSVPREEAERARLRILLHEAAFATGLTARDVIGLSDASPPLREAMGLPPHHVALLYGVWLDRETRPWGTVGPARTVFELAAGAPTTAGELLAHEPGLLLLCRTDPDVETELGPLLVTAAGVSIDELTMSDPAAEVRVESAGRELVFGPHALKLGTAIPVEFAADVKAWLRFRAEVLAEYPATHLRPDAKPAPGLLDPFAANCPHCDTTCASVVGAIARRL